MKVELGRSVVEGFTKAYLLRFENGLMLRSTDILWSGKKGAEEIKTQLLEVVKALEKAGFKVSGHENLE